MFNNKSENVKKIDISPILKNVEQCIQSGLEDKLHMFFNDYEKYEKTHNEVLNLTVVKNLVNHSKVLPNILNNNDITCEIEDKNIDNLKSKIENDTNYKYDQSSSIFIELTNIKHENNYLKEELNKYKKMISDMESSYVNLEIKEKNCKCVCKCNNNQDNINIVNKILSGQSAKNIILQEEKQNENNDDQEEEVEEENSEEEGDERTSEQCDGHAERAHVGGE